MAAIAGTIASMMMNATLPVGASGIPGTWIALPATAMKIRLNSGTSTTAAAGTELSGTGYTTGGSNITTASTPSTAGGNVVLPGMAAGMSWTNGGAAWTIASLDVTASDGSRTWFGLFNAQPIAVGSGNTFQIAQNAVTVALS